MYQEGGLAPLGDMHMMTPGVAASLTPTSAERTAGTDATPKARRRLRMPHVLLHVPHPHLHLPHRHA